MKFLLSALIASNLSCGLLHSNPVTGFIDCATVDTGKLIVDLGLTIMGDVAKVLIEGDETWSQALAELETKLTVDGKKVGSDAIACAVRDFDQFAAQFGDGSGSSSNVTPAVTLTYLSFDMASSRARAKVYLANKHFK